MIPHGSKRQEWVEKLRPGEQVASRVTGDIGDVIERTELGIRIRWRVGVTEFVLFTQPESLCRKSWRTRVPVRKGLDDVTPAEKARILAAIAEVRAEKRARGEARLPGYEHVDGCEQLAVADRRAS